MLAWCEESAIISSGKKRRLSHYHTDKWNVVNCAVHRKGQFFYCKHKPISLIHPNFRVVYMIFASKWRKKRYLSSWQYCVVFCPVGKPTRFVVIRFGLNWMSSRLLNVPELKNVPEWNLYNEKNKQMIYIRQWEFEDVTSSKYHQDNATRGMFCQPLLSADLCTVIDEAIESRRGKARNLKR